MYYILSYDTIRLIHPTQDALRIVESVKRRFPAMQKGTGQKEAMYRNMRVSVLYGELSVANSFNTFHKGSNLQPLTLTELSEAIERLSHVLRVDLRESRVTRVDIAGNIEVSHGAVSNYLYTLGEMPRFDSQRMRSKTWKYYHESNTRSKGEVFQLEDKIAEMKRHRIDIPTAYRDKNIIRIESQIIGKQQLVGVNGGIVTVPMLTEKRFYKAMCERWHKRFMSIQPVRSYIMLNVVPKTKKQLLYTLASVGLAHFSTAYTKDLIRQMKDGSEKEKARDLIGRALNREDIAQSNENYEELRVKVEEIFNRSIAELS